MILPAINRSAFPTPWTICTAGMPLLSIPCALASFIPAWPHGWCVWEGGGAHQQFHLTLSSIDTDPTLTRVESSEANVSHTGLNSLQLPHMRDSYSIAHTSPLDSTTSLQFSEEISTPAPEASAQPSNDRMERKSCMVSLGVGWWGGVSVL